MMANLIPVHRRGRLANTGFEDFYNVLDDFFNDPWMTKRRRDAFKLDIRQTDEEYLIEAELPGANKDEISIEIAEGTLRIAYNHEEKKEQDDKNYIHRERCCISSSRSIYLGDVDAEGVNAKLEGGILKIEVPRQKVLESTRKIEIE